MHLRILQIPPHIRHHPRITHFRAIASPHIEFLELNKIFTDYIRNTFKASAHSLNSTHHEPQIGNGGIWNVLGREFHTPFYQQPRDIRRHLNTSPDLTQFRRSFEDADLSACATEGDCGGETTDPGSAEANMEILGLGLGGC
jgi:hypothetical protein